MSEDVQITLEGFLSVVKIINPITVNLYNKNNILLITFILDGYKSLDDSLKSNEILSIEFSNNKINITINTTEI